MANPQPDKYTKISNELYSAIMRTDFSKRQRNILDLIIRMSYGCGKKYAILRNSDFEVVGVFKNHIKEELEYLVNSKVIFIDGEIIALNKNYEQWRIGLIKKSKESKFTEILKRNLGQISIPKTGTSIPEIGTKVPKIGTNQLMGSSQNRNYGTENSSQNRNQVVPKTGTDTTLEVGNGADSQPCKESIKEINNKEKDIHHDDIDTKVPKYNIRFAKFFKKEFCTSLTTFQFDILNAFVDKDLMDEDLVIEAISRAKRNAEGDPVKYAESVLRNWRTKNIKTMDQVNNDDSNFKQKVTRQRAGPGKIPRAFASIQSWAKEEGG